MPVRCSGKKWIEIKIKKRCVRKHKFVTFSDTNSMHLTCGHKKMEAFFNEREQLGIKPGDYATSGWQLGTYRETIR
jgi:hypothetical protein